jgi:TatD DNase family protein
MIFDSHAHYDDERFDEDRDALITSLPEKGIGAVLNSASDISSSRAAAALAERFSHFWASAGVHPQAADTLDDDALHAIEMLTRQERVVAIGEIGLDYYYEDNPAHEVQRAAFERQLQLAHDLDLPVIIHSRDAAQETFDLVKKYRPRGVVHCFSGSAQLAREYVDLGMYVGFTGVVTFKGAKKPLEAARAAGIDHILVETDCPYLAPVPFRGKRCDSTMLPRTVAVLADSLAVSVEKLVDSTWKNACDVYEISPSFR